MFISKRDLEGLQVRLVALEREVAELKHENRIYRRDKKSLPMFFSVFNSPTCLTYTVKEIVELLLVYHNLKIIETTKKVSLRQSLEKE